jgi:hypothetical protein
VASIFTDESPAFSAVSKRFSTSAGALRRQNLHRPDALPVETFNQRHQLRVAQPDLGAAQRRPDEMRMFETLGEQAQARAVEPDDLDPVSTTSFIIPPPIRCLEDE